MRKIFIVLPLLIVLHATEEYYFGLHGGVSSDLLTGVSLLPLFSSFNTYQAIYITYIIMQVLLFLAVALALYGSKKTKKLLCILIGLLFIYQSHHIVEAIITQSYNPGLITSCLFIIFGYYYWRKLIKNTTSFKS